MAMRPEVYQPPPRETRDPPDTFTTYPAGDDDAGSHRMKIRIEYAQGQVVEFSIQQETLVDAEWLPVARVDSCGTGTVHRHQFVRSGADLLDHEPILVIPVTESAAALARGYEIAYDRMHDEYADNLRRWDRGSRRPRA